VFHILSQAVRTRESYEEEHKMAARHGSARHTRVGSAVAPLAASFIAWL